MRLLLPFAAAAQVALSEGVSKSYGYLSLERSEYCASAPTPFSKLDETAPYPATPHAQQPNAEARLMVQSYRGDDGLQGIMRSCSMVEGGSDDAACDEELSLYVSGMFIWAAPAVGGVFAALVWSVCCMVASCRCCRRCCLCTERKGPRPARAWQKCAVVLVAFVCSVCVFAGTLAAYGYTGDVNVGVNDMLCQLVATADEALNGSPDLPKFLGMDEGINRIAMVRRLLDVDGRAMTDLRAILDETASFAAALDALTMRVNHMKTVLTLVGQHKLLEHSCWFCKRAAGNNVTGEPGLLGELAVSMQASSAEAMRKVQLVASTALTGRSLVEVSTAVSRGEASLETFKRGFGGTLVDGYMSYFPFVRVAEDARHTLFRFICALCAFHALVLSNIAICQTKRSHQKYPTSTTAMVTWCCGFFAATVALLFAGGLILIAIPVSEVCHFWRHDLLTHRGVAEYYLQVGLFDQSSPNKAMDTLAVDVWRTCLTSNGTGDVLNALQLRGKLDFQRVLQEGFTDLEDKMAGSVVDVAKLELLTSQAAAFGGLFVLDPDDPLPLESDAAPKMIGSTLYPEDRDGPDGEAKLYGLNTYASLIAGPGSYSFEHGTSGGGRLITATSPAAEEVAGELAVRQNALVYARYKESLLTDPSMFRCDVMDSSFQVTEKACSYQEFTAAVTEYAEEIREAGLRLGEQAVLAKQRIAYDLQSSLEQLMIQVKALRELFTCRFLWKRWEDFDLSLCGGAMPAMLNGVAAWIVLAIAALGLLVMHYKMWRHLLDNRVIGEELDHFARKYGYLSTT